MGQPTSSGRWGLEQIPLPHNMQIWLQKMEFMQV